MKRNTGGFAYIELMIVIAVIILLALIGWTFWQSKSRVSDKTVSEVGAFSSSENLKQKNSPMCIDWAKKIEGDNYSGIHTLNCEISPRKISNSDIKAYYLDYSGKPKDTSVCEYDVHFGRSPMPIDYRYCTGWNGVVLDNGQKFFDVGYVEDNYASMLYYDYCYSSAGGREIPKPSKRDLYYYEGELYERDLFVNVEQKLKYGTCILNGTTLHHLIDKNGSAEKHITNVKIDYVGFPKNCKSVMRTVEDMEECYNTATAANAVLDQCYSNEVPIFTGDKITGYEKEQQLYVGQYQTTGDCESIYVQRMAALNRCNEISHEELKLLCRPLVLHPSEDGDANITRVFAPI